jgi:hypothetical protein
MRHAMTPTLILTIKVSLPARQHGPARRRGTGPRAGSGRRWRIWLQSCLLWLICLAILPLAGGIGGTSASSAAAQEAGCATSGPDSGVYSVRLCLTMPAQGDTLSGDVTVTAAVDVVSGLLPPVEHVQFLFTPADRDSSSSVLRDFISPYTFTLPTGRWPDRAYRLEADVHFDDEVEYTTPRTGIVVSTANDVTRAPFGTGRWEPERVEGNGPVVVAAVGDGAGGLPSADDVAGLIEGWSPDMLLYLGDVYNTGSYTEFMNYYDPTLGRMKDITNPVPGNHEGGSQYQGYRDYWDSNLHHYTTMAGSWRLIALDSTERYGQTSPGTGQFEWLRQELAKDDDAGCTMVFFHEPRWGLVSAGDNDYLGDLWQLLAEEDVDIVLTAHEHNYQRWSPMDASGEPVANGPMHFVVGTGGHDLRKFGQDDPRVLARQSTFGALRLELAEGEASFEFIDTAGSVLDAGSAGCGGAAVPLPPGDDDNGEEEEDEVATTGMGTIVNTGGAEVRCRVAPDLNAEIVTSLPEGAVVELRGEPIGEWRPVRCAERDGFISASFVEPQG